MRKLLVGFLCFIVLVMGAGLYIYISPSLSSDQWKVKLYVVDLIGHNRITIIDREQFGSYLY